MKVIGKKTLEIEGRDNKFFPFSPLDRELLAVRQGVKPLLRTFISENDIQLIVRQLYGTNLFYTISPDKYKDYIYSLKKTAVGGHHILYVASCKETIDRILKLDNKAPFKASLEIGELLGYPECCAAFFNKARRMKRSDYVNGIIANSGERNPLLNFFEQNAALISHYPCSLDCSKSIAMAEKTLELIKEKSAGAAQKHKAYLTGGFLYSTETDAYLRFGSRTEKGGAVYYGNVLFCGRSRSVVLDTDGDNGFSAELLAAADHAVSYRDDGRSVIFCDSGGREIYALKKSKSFALIDFAERHL